MVLTANSSFLTRTARSCRNTGSSLMWKTAMGRRYGIPTVPGNSDSGLPTWEPAGRDFFRPAPAFRKAAIGGFKLPAPAVVRSIPATWQLSSSLPPVILFIRSVVPAQDLDRLVPSAICRHPRDGTHSRLWGQAYLLKLA